MRDLTTLREEIDKTDRELLSLFTHRMKLCTEVADYKIAHRLPVLDASREKQVLAEKMRLLEEKELENAVYEFFSSVMAISRGLQSERMESTLHADALCEILNQVSPPIQNPRICYFGTQGSYSEAAAIEYFGAEKTRFCAESFSDVFAALKNGEADYAVAPLENSSTGAIADVEDLLEKCGCFMVGEVNLPIHHCLLAKKGTTLSEIQTVYSHEQGLLQSGDYLRTLGKIDQQVCCSTAYSAKRVAQSADRSVAAIAGRQNAALYDLEILAENINSSAKNTTRFAVIARQPEIEKNSDKISIAFTLPHECGELHRVLACFARGGLNLLKLESRPIPNERFSYMFFVDYSGNLLDPQVQEITRAVMKETQRFTLIGNYPTARMEAAEE